ncbi:multidrug effflux MFS transporter [Actinotalea fermentans]|uniref:Putative multidrug resistance transporter, Bcr/CflA family protein n=1 Tax=Actinotalea fermentans TaxID=43671 RepID=A0A511Z0P3_9CELL|nr:multidrug effflux MFS transporter [Actinotalea fermentans]GEN81003.1 putative multidrug resistance transporter, Bcr/CflA family protein [Actinotalea fermentans]
MATPSPPARDRTSTALLATILGAMAFLPAATTDMYLPSLPDVARDLQTSEAAVALTISWVLAGAAVAQLVIGPLSDRVGRRRPAVVGLGVYVVVALACAVAATVTQLIALRVVQGAVGAAGTVVATAVIGDRWRGAEAARMLSRLWLAIAVGPVLAPLAGTVVAGHWGWRGVFVALAVTAALIVAAVLRWLPETRPPAQRSTERLADTFRGYREALRDGQFVAFALLPGLALAVIMSYVTGSTFVFQREYGLDPTGFAIAFGTGATSMLAGSQANAVLVRRYGPDRLLAVALPAVVATTLAVLVVASGRFGGVVGVLVPLWLTVGLLSSVLANASALALARLPGRSGTASAVLGFSQGALGGLVSPLVGALGGTGTAMACVMVGLALVSVVVLWAGTPVRPWAPRDAAGAGSVHSFE